MGLGILDPRRPTEVPGTTRYFDDLEGLEGATSTSTSAQVKRDNGIILVPQPSDDPNDPLNWPLWKRDLILLLLSIVSIFATSLGPILAANTISLSVFFSVKFTKVAILTGWFLFGVGIAAIWFVPSARIWGKRHLFLLGTITLIFSSAWAGAAGHSYGSLAGARFIQGIGAAPFETLVNAVVGDMYFVHQRGKRMALTNLAVFGGAFFTPIVVGKITYTIGWPWTFYFVSIFCGVSLPLVYFFVPETTYCRSAHLNTDTASSVDIHHLQKPHTHEHTTDLSPSNAQSLELSEASIQNPSAQPESQDPPTLFTGAGTPKKSFTELLVLFCGRMSPEKFWKLALRPFPLFCHPAIMWACLTQGAMVGWTVFISVVIAGIFIGPPLWYGEVQTGYAFTGAFIGAVGGFLLAGAVADWSAKVMTRRNGGIYEPEFRIVLVIPQLILGCTGLYLFGATSTPAGLIKHGWIVPVVAFGLQVAGMVIGAVAASLYLVDAHRDIAVEAFTCTIIFKNFFSFGLTFSAYQWVIGPGGTFRVFMWISSIQVVVCLLSIPMYVFGKRNRDFFHRHNILKLCGLMNKRDT
ncbi:MFS general substrate transporter [Venustampulla echinocandica]|uniref:MFS general substrate transporter n=1 Tax=Venustampulla echinocandica TaxID=2656787 RepID=A0A370TM59_9HELO|nr:MFS general substrate transporter [Venustampulla echinocandica]RDL36610.1 MFS general substrate transporter [Venustampulla echinocandica]